MKRFSLASIWTPRLYDLIARHYDRFSWLVSPIGRASQEKLVDDLEPGTVLDVGCGTGTLLAMAHTRGLRCYGIDTSSGMLTEARRNIPLAELVQASTYQIPFPDRSFDQVVETNALSGLLIEVERALCEMLRVCRSGGTVLLADYAVLPQMGWTHRLIRRVGALIGDYPQDYVSLFGALGYRADVEILGGHGMYQLIRVTKEPRPSLVE